MPGKPDKRPRGREYGGRCLGRRRWIIVYSAKEWQAEVPSCGLRDPDEGDTISYAIAAGNEDESLP